MLNGGAEVRFCESFIGKESWVQEGKCSEMRPDERTNERMDERDDHYIPSRQRGYKNQILSQNALVVCLPNVPLDLGLIQNDTLQIKDPSPYKSLISVLWLDKHRLAYDHIHSYDSCKKFGLHFLYAAVKTYVFTAS